MGTVKNATYKVHNGTDFDEIHFKTKAAQVFCEDGKTVESQLAEKVNKAIQNFTPTLLNGWTNVGGEYAILKVWKDELNNVRIQGVLNKGSDKLIFTLPSGYRPTGNLRVSIMSVNSMGEWVSTGLMIRSTGNVETQGVVTEYHSIDITFTIES